MITDINQLDFSKKYTYADYLTWRFTERVELIKGRIFKMLPTPTWRHQRVSNRINNALFNALDYEVLTAPFDVRLSQQKDAQTIITVVQPDICVVCDKHKLDNAGCHGAPDLVVEILSKSTSKKDLTDKKTLYEENGVQEYWVVHPYEGTVLQFVLQNGVYVQAGIFTPEDQLPSAVFADFSLDLTKVFEE